MIVNDNPQGQAKCKPCGSSAESLEGAKVCSCVGANRYFLMSDGSCRCKVLPHFLPLICIVFFSFLSS